MKHMEVKIIWTCGLLLIYLIGCFCAKVSDEHVTFLDKVMVWKGSCVMLPCEYKAKETIDQFLWYYNATYNEKTKEFNGTIVYDSKNKTAVDHSFVGRVQYVGRQSGDCTIVIRNIQKQHEGIYQLRLWSTGNFRWMSKQSVTITVPETGPTLELPLRQEIKESETVTLTCTIRYYCPFNNITLYWIEEVNGTSTTNVRNDTTGVLTSSSLVFHPSWKDDKKNITCVLERDGGEADNKSVQLNVLHAPQNVQVLPNNATIKIKKTDLLTLTCSVESSNPPNYEITWFKDNKQQSSKRGSANQIEVNSSGKYFCKAKNKIGELTSNSVEVSVLYPPDKPVIKTNPKIIKEGTDIKLECSTKANPPVFRYIWYKDMEVCYNHTGAWFTISKITEDDSGSYTCSARNELGEKESDNLVLNVMYAPRYPSVVLQLGSRQFGEEDKTIFVEGDNVIFQCEVNSSNPDVIEFIWYKDGKEIEKPSKPLKAEDAGEYKCEADNRIGRTMSPVVNVDINFSPKDVQIEVPIKTVKENESVRLRCLSKRSKPEISRYEWYKDGVLLKTSTSEAMEFQLEWTHTGWYTCKAINDIGPGISKRKHIDVQYAPQNVTLSVIPGDHVTEFTDVKLTCTSKGNPASLYYQFYRNNVYVSKGNHYHDLIDVKIQNTGEYYCSAGNSVGDRRSNVVSLHVSYSSATIGKFASIGVSSFIVLLILIFLIVRFRICIRNAFRRKAVDGKSDSSFFVLKKSNNESADNMGRQIPSMHSSTDQLNYSTVNVPAPAKRRINPPSPMEDNDITTVYSVVRKVPHTAEYENIASSTRDHEDTQDDIHYSVIANLNKKAPDRERGPDVEYAKLRHL